MTKDELIEGLAAIEHERWSNWQQWVHTRGYWQNGDLCLAEERVSAWERQIATPYADLSEPEKQSDREQVDRYWPLFVGFVAEWVEKNAMMVNKEGRLLLTQWHEEMGQGPKSG